MQMADSTGADLESAVIMDLELEISERIRMYAECSNEDELLSKSQDGMDSDGNNEHRDHLNLDSDLDSDALEDEIDKSKGHNDSVESLNEELALAEPPVKSEPKPRRLLFKRKTIPEDDKTAEEKPPTKKVILHQQKPNLRTPSLQPTGDKVDEKPPKTRVEPPKDKVQEKTSKPSPKTRIEPPKDKVEEKSTKTTPKTRVLPPSHKVEEKPTKVTPKPRVHPPNQKVEENLTQTTPKTRVEPPKDKVQEKPTKLTPKTRIEPPKDKIVEKPTKATPKTRVEPPKDEVEVKPIKTTHKTRVEPPKDIVEESPAKTTPKTNSGEPAVNKADEKPTKTTLKTDRVKITAPVDSAPAYRANRDKILQMNEAQKKQDRLNRFGPVTGFGTGKTAVPHSREDIENFKKRAERFDKSPR